MTAYWTEAVIQPVRYLDGSLDLLLFPSFPQPSFLPGAALSLPAPARPAVLGCCKLDRCRWSRKLEPWLEDGSERQGSRG